MGGESDPLNNAYVRRLKVHILKPMTLCSQVKNGVVVEGENNSTAKKKKKTSYHMFLVKHTVGWFRSAVVIPFFA